MLASYPCVAMLSFFVMEAPFSLVLTSKPTPMKDHVVIPVPSQLAQITFNG